MKMAVFRVVATCKLVEVYRRFRGFFCLHHQADIVLMDPQMMQAASTSETTADLYQTALCNNPENTHSHTYPMRTP